MGEEKIPQVSKKSGNKAYVDREKCKPADCLKCKEECRLKAIIAGENGESVIDMNECFGCGDCVKICPRKAIKILWAEGTEPDKPHSRFEW